MTNAMRIIFFLILTTFWTCGTSPSPQRNRNSENQIDNSLSSITFIDGHYQIDTAFILSNKNLKKLIKSLENTDLAEKKSVSEIPIFIKTFLDEFTDSFSIANPVEEWQDGCIIENPPLPARQLIYLGLGSDIALMTFYSGGWGITEHILILTYKDNKILDFWCGNGMSDHSNKLEILNYLKESMEKNRGLNTNSIYF